MNGDELTFPWDLATLTASITMFQRRRRRELKLSDATFCVFIQVKVVSLLKVIDM